MFRVHFDERTGAFVLQVLRLHFLWRVVQREISGKDGSVFVDVSFQTYEDAIAHVKAIGLDKLYRDGSRNRLVEAMSRP